MSAAEICLLHGSLAVNDLSDAIGPNSLHYKALAVMSFISSIFLASEADYKARAQSPALIAPTRDFSAYYTLEKSRLLP